MGGSPRGGADPDDRLMLGVQLPDGRRLVMQPGSVPPAGVDPFANPAAPALTSMVGGLVGDLSQDFRYWLRPLPPAGRMLVVVRWSALGIQETLNELDAAALSAAGSSATVLWPQAPIEQRVQRPSPPPPTTGWFAQTS
ncbi:hypothetical protein [Nakamurella endophytica]|nr:hypothetical protein [Nakamurella endophytica]